jgi:hypothetical protein
VKVALTPCPVQTEAALGVLANNAGPVGCAVTFTVTVFEVAFPQPFPDADTTHWYW